MVEVLVFNSVLGRCNLRIRACHIIIWEAIPAHSGFTNRVCQCALDALITIGKVLISYLPLPKHKFNIKNLTKRGRKGLSKNYVIKHLGMKFTRFSALGETLISSVKTKNSTKQQRAAIWLSFLCSTRASADTGSD